MALTEAQQRAHKKYKKEKCAQINIVVTKEKNAAYRSAAAKLGLPFARFIKLGVEEYARNHKAGLPRELTENSLTATEKMLLKRFNSIPAKAQQDFMKLMWTLAVKCGAQLEETED